MKSTTQKIKLPPFQLYLFLIPFSLFYSSCSTNRYSSRYSDDVYFSSVPSTNESNYSSSDNNDKSNPDNYSKNYNNSNDQNYSNNNSNNPIDSTVASDQNSSNDLSSNNGSSNRYSDGNGNTYITNNYYDNDDYYDYAYTARLRRFNHSCGWNYYDPYYTNLYWYDYNPYSYGVSLYTTYHWWGVTTTFGYNSWWPSYGSSWCYPSYYGCYNGWNNGWG